MTPVVTLQRRFRELGRVRMGEQVPTRSGGKRPAALRQWRLTAYGDTGRGLLEQAAALWGGQVRPWENAPAGGGWELKTETDRLPFLVPPTADPFTVWLEKWTAAGCERRCDGETALTYHGRGKGWREGPCRCENPADPARRECSIVLRFGIILPDLDGLGVWHVQTHSYHGAEELQGALAILGARASQGIATAAWLRIEPREIRRPAVDANGETKVEVSKFVVPVIDVDQTLRELLAGEGDRLALPSAATTPRGRPALPAGAPELPPGPGPRVETVPPPAPDDEPPAPAAAPDPQTPPPGTPGDASPRLTAEERRSVIETWRGLGFTDAAIQAVILEETGKASTGEITTAERWRIEGALRRLRSEGSAE